MNLLLLEPGELAADGEVALGGDRARHLRDVLRVGPGRTVRAGIVDGPIGRAEVISVDGHGVRLRFAARGAAPARPRVDLLLALPRPKVLKRLWAPLASLGVGRILLANADRVERYYFDSHAVRPETWRPRLLDGLSQARDTRVPVVEVHRALKILIEDALDQRCPDTRRLIADPAYRRSAYGAAQKIEADERVLLALGPEGGWSDHERDLFERHGFVGVGLGPRVLRTDVAAVALLALVHDALRTA